MTQQQKTRDSNMELLRVVAMLMVMLIHASYRALPAPTPESIEASPDAAFLQLLVEGFTIMAVDVFVMLSGWYGIRLRPLRLAELLFQVVFFGVVCAAVDWTVTGTVPPHVGKTILMLGEGDYWFVKTYVALYLFAPVLNAFVETASRRQFAATLVAVLAFQWLFGWVFEATSWLRSGYSLPSFMALYLLARYMRTHRPWFARLSRRTDLAVYVSTALFTALAVFLLKRHFNLGGVLLFYNSPVVIVGAASLLLFFSKLSFRSRLVNWLALSALSIYLTHSSSFVGHYYDDTIRLWHDACPRPAFVLRVAALIAAVFLGSILLDKLRLLLWRAVAGGLFFSDFGRKGRIITWISSKSGAVITRISTTLRTFAADNQ